MYRIRLHGRGGQGIKTAGRILGSAFFHAGFEVQDAPRYGAERRGAPIFASVRAAREPIGERGSILRPDLVVVADDTLISVPAAGVLQGLSPRSVLLIESGDAPEVWRERLALEGRVLALPAPAADEAAALRGPACAAAAARLVGVLDWADVEHGLEAELADLGEPALAASRERARAAWDAMESHAGLVEPAPREAAAVHVDPGWVDVPFETARLAAPEIVAAASSEAIDTGAWRSMRPVIDYGLCNHCWWICSTLCPDGAIDVAPDRRPVIDYDHCKGCLICASVCPPHAIRVVPEREAAAEPEAARAAGKADTAGGVP